MAFDMGFDFRNTAGYVTDPAYAVPVLTETYPHTYTNGNGQSINAGWDSAPNPANRTSTNDPRLAGWNGGGASETFKVDLSSGSAPGAGTYTIDLAMGDSLASYPQPFQVKDTSTVLIDGSGGFTQNAGQFVDATLTVVTASTNWTGTTVSKTFATTLAGLLISIGQTATAAHFRLTLQGAAATNVFRRTLSMFGTRIGTRQVMRP